MNPTLTQAQPSPAGADLAGEEAMTPSAVGGGDVPLQRQSRMTASMRSFSHDEDRRVERKRQGLVKFHVEKTVPDFGATGWRTKAGNMLKNQQWYRSNGRFNLWNDPIHAGRDTWKYFHAPRLRTDGGLMEQRDKKDKRNMDWARRQQFVNESRQETLERFYQRKLVNQNLEHSSAWAPAYRGKREVCDYFDTFDNDFDALPEVALKKVITPTVVERDEEAVRFITKNYQKEANFERRWKEWEQHRQFDIRHDFYRRRAYNEELQRLSGQPVRTINSSPFRTTKNERYSSTRVKTLAQPKRYKEPDDHTIKIDYRGLMTADCRLALDTLKHGAFVSTTNFCGFPHRKPGEEVADEEPRLRKTLPIAGKSASLDLPVSPLRLTKPAGRHLHEVHQELSSDQIMSHVGSPAHNPANRHVLETREEQLAVTPRSPCGPGPRHGAYTYPMKAPADVATRSWTRKRLDDDKNNKQQAYPSETMSDFVADTALFKEEIRSSSQTRKSPPHGTCAESGFASLSQGFVTRQSPRKTLKDEMDQFEQFLAPQYIPHLGNFFMSDAGPVRGRDA
eukprot:GEMP01026340.1.p1 GENE.GEMP01026340.1~~GEMP01026340.1.p1  ORF type:complete len:589 (+),score=134.90 GEMP01026340.1:78-1769(+)